MKTLDLLKHCRTSCSAWGSVGALVTRGMRLFVVVFAAMTVFSFHPVKIITSAEGGMVLTNRPQLAERLQRLRSHGMTRDPQQMNEPSHGPWYYQQIELGFNYRITDLQAALGLSQLGKLEE